MFGLVKIGGKEKIREEIDGKVAQFPCLIHGKERCGWWCGWMGFQTSPPSCVANWVHITLMPFILQFIDFLIVCYFDELFSNSLNT